MSAKKTCLVKLKKEMVSFMRDPPPHIPAVSINESNILEWHYLIEGPPDTPYEGGWYIGKLKFPPDYPFKPPAIMMVTASGRFKTGTRLCLSMSDFHPETWNPMWSVASVLTGLLSFMLEETSTTGSVETTVAEKQSIARESGDKLLQHPAYRTLFPQLADLIQAQRDKKSRKGATPGTGDVAQNTERAIPGTNDVAPSTEEGTSGSGGAKLGSDSVALRLEESTPGSGGMTPGTDDVTPSTVVATPGTGNGATGVGSEEASTGKVTSGRETFDRNTGGDEIGGAGQGREEEGIREGGGEGLGGVLESGRIVSDSEGRESGIGESSGGGDSKDTGDLGPREEGQEFSTEKEKVKAGVCGEVACALDSSRPGVCEEGSSSNSESQSGNFTVAEDTTPEADLAAYISVMAADISTMAASGPFQEAALAASKGDLETALRLCQVSLDQACSPLHGCLLAVDICLKLGRFEAARSHLRAAAQSTTLSNEVARLSRYVTTLEARLEEAYWLLQGQREAGSGEGATCANTGGDPEGALKVFDGLLLGACCKAPHIMMLKARALVVLGDMEGAIAAMEGALDVSSREALQEDGPGSNTDQSQDVVALIPLVTNRQILDAMSNIRAALRNKARANDLYRKKIFPAALKAYDSSLAAEDTCAVVHCNRAATLSALNRHGEALEASKRALQLYAGYSKAIRRYGDSLATIGTHEYALQEYLKLLKLSPNDVTLQKLVLREQTILHLEECYYV